MGMTIKNAFIVNSFKSMIPVQVKIGAEYFQVTTVGSIIYLLFIYYLLISYRYANKKFFGV